MPTLGELMGTLPQKGTVEWIGVRPGRREDPGAADSSYKVRLCQEQRRWSELKSGR